MNECGSVSIRVQQEDVYLHPHLEFWTQLIAKVNYTEKIRRFAHCYVCRKVNYSIKLENRRFGHYYECRKVNYTKIIRRFGQYYGCRKVNYTKKIRRFGQYYGCRKVNYTEKFRRFGHYYECKKVNYTQDGLVSLASISTHLSLIKKNKKTVERTFNVCKT